jgi:hypothetical protein
METWKGVKQLRALLEGRNGARERKKVRRHRE